MALFLGEVTEGLAILFALGFLLAFFLLALVSWFLNRVVNRPPSLSPYSGRALRPASDLGYFYKVRVFEHMAEIENFENRTFLFRRSSFCRETGRIFPNSVTWYGAIQVDWSFLSKRHPGHYVSWGSLTEEQKGDILVAHGTLEGFQTTVSCPAPAPSAITAEYVYTKPGPLYVDLTSRVVIGWKRVPGIEMEMLVVQKPRRT